MIKQYLVIDCEFNQLNYSGIIGNLYNNPPAYAIVKVVWVDPMDWYPLNGKAQYAIGER